jgi:MFS family permease
MFRSLRNRNYRYYAAGSLIANVGTWLQRVAQDWLVLQLTAGSAVALGITTGLQFLPFLLIAPFGGLIADRFPKRRVLQLTQFSMGVTAAGLAVLDLTNVVEVWHVYALTFLFGVASAIDNPARQSFVVEMVGREDLPNAVGLNSASFNTARVLGPAIAGFLIVLVGTGWVIMLNAVSYGATIWALHKMRPAELHSPDPAPRKPGMLVDGLTYVRNRPDLVLILAVVFFVGSFGLNFQMTSALMATEVFGKGAGEYGVLGTLLAVGAVVGSLAAAKRGTTGLRLVMVPAIAFGVLEIGAGMLPSYTSYALSLPVLGFIQLTFITAANAMMQLTVAPEMRGRVLALYSMVFIGSKPLGAPLLGWVGEAFGARWTVIGGGLVSLFGTLLAGYLVLRWRRMRVRVSLRPRPRIHVLRHREMADHPAPPHETVPAAPATRDPAGTPDPVSTPHAATTPEPDATPGTVVASHSSATPRPNGASQTTPGNDATQGPPQKDAALAPSDKAASEPQAQVPAAREADVPAVPATNMSAPGDKLPAWKLNATSRCSKPIPADSSRRRAKGLPHLSPRAHPGRSRTS